MGHSRIGRIPATRKWRQVVSLISAGADVAEVAAATASAAEQTLERAADDPLLRRAFWLLTQIPLAARQPDFAQALRQLGLEVGESPTLGDVCAAAMAALDKLIFKHGRRSDFGEMAQLSLVESLGAVAGREASDLFGPTYAADATRTALGALGTMTQFSVLARDFFARLTRRCLDYFLSRELPNHVGLTARFHSLAEHRDFEQAIDQHCHEATRIIRDFAAEWFSKSNYEGGIDEAKAGRFAHVAFGKLCSELIKRREAYA
jgi:hypothetical protein